MGVSRYDEIAAWYDEWLSGDTFPDDGFYPFVEALLGDVARILVRGLLAL